MLSGQQKRQQQKQQYTNTHILKCCSVLCMSIVVGWRELSRFLQLIHIHITYIHTYAHTNIHTYIDYVCGCLRNSSFASFVALLVGI